MLSGSIYSQNNSCLIPQVESMRSKKGTFSIKQLKTISFPAEWRIPGRALTGDWKEWLNLSVAMTASEGSVCVKKVPMQAPEMYTLEITHRNIIIRTGDLPGMNHAFATLFQLLLSARGGELPQLVICDKPRFAYRGVMIDCSRHFWTIGQLKKYIRQLAFFKLNTLHLHLTDNQGWRLYLDKYPELAAKGTYYRAFKELSGQYYRKDELRELIRYAAMYGIEIIPEVDLPGHCLALLAALPQLSCKGGEFEAYPEESDGKERKRAGENMLCVGNPKTYEFVEDLVTELADLFPSPFIHLGGDEVSTHIWEECPKCRQLYKERNMTSWHELQDYFTRQVSRIVRSKGKKMIGWDEINDRGAAHPADVLMIWQRDGSEQQRTALKSGLSVIMSPKDPCYLDFGYSRNSTRRLYEWEPAGKECADVPTRLVKGGQANLWTEFIATPQEVEKMLYPRLCALAETLWNTPEKRDWNDFRRRIAGFDTIFERLDISSFKKEDWDNRGFVPQHEQACRLVSPARMETNMDGIKYYNPEYVFDGDPQTFFATPYSLEKGAYFTLVLEEARSVRGIKVLFDASKEHPEQVQLSVSRDGMQFEKVPATNSEGELSVLLDSPALVKAVKIELTAPLMARLNIREFILH
ncbi:beta-N-acetylhexosaminidase [uncultured Bacteroides sp.]|nr:family 20 glycosylhydrolase [uncultured Bacteroides sp.]